MKMEIESTSRQRRQSAPAPIAISLTSPNQHRDEAYLRAITKFNEWRNNQRFERLNETKNASGITQVPPIDQSTITADFSMISDVLIDDNEKRRLIELHRDDKQKEIRRLNHNVVLQNTQQNQRMSLPNIRENPIAKPQRKKSRKSQIHPSCKIDEIEEFEQNHCNQMDLDFTANVQSPPSKFYLDNSDPFFEPTKLTPETREITPRRQSLMGRNMLRRKSSAKGKAPQPPIASESEASSNFLNGNFKHYAIDSLSVYDEFLKASKNYKANMRQQDPEKVNSVGESASSGSLSSDQEKSVKKLRRLSPPYQTVINKHGDEVEYALPYNERDSLSNIPPLPTSAPPGHATLPQATFEQIINENFQFLHSNVEFFNAEDTLIQKQMIDAAFDPIDTSFSDVRRRNLQITDLDKSNDTGLVTPAQSGDIICRELDSLSTWTRNLKNCDQKKDKLNEKSPIDEYKLIEKNVRVFNSNEIRFKSGILRNSFSTPLELSTGYFNTTPVTLRSTLPNVYSINSFADSASKREFEILSQMRHQSISTLMGISHDPDLRVMSLVMEPFDYTLNHYLHQMDQYFSIQQTVSIVLQIASATQYLHECGFVHSNISSHAVLISESPFAVKLSSFELTTEILPRESFDRIYCLQKLNDEDRDLLMSEPADAAMAEKYYKLSKQHFFNRTSLPTFNRKQKEDDNEARLPYSVAYRRMFSMHYYQAPELLVPSDDSDVRYVLPTPRSDTFALGLLLWEALNHCVPFVVYNHDELIKSHKRNDAKLPMLDKTSIAFADIFNSCLRVNADERVSDVFELITMLDEIQRAGEGKQPLARPQIVQSAVSQESKKSLKNTRISEKVPEKIYYSRPETDTLKRADNVITMENLRNLDNKNSSKISESMRSSELEAQITSFSKQPGILIDDTLDRIRKTVEDQRVVAPQKPTRRMDDGPDAFEVSKRSFADSTMYQSFFDFNRLHTPKVDKNGIYERTSTLKKRLKGPESQKQKRSVKELFDKKPSQTINDAFDKMNNELSQIVQDYNRNDFMNEIVQELNSRQQSGRDEAGLSSFLNCGMTNNAHDQSRSFEDLPTKSTPELPKIKRSGSDNVNHISGYRFALGNYSLPKTPIALKNKIRRNAWLSDGKKSSEGEKPVAISKPNKSISDFSNSSHDFGFKNNRKQYNVSIKIHHNDLETTPKQKKDNLSQNDSNIKIILYPSTDETDGSSPLVKVNNVELNVSQHDINKKYYPMMPEMLSDVIQNKRDRSGFLQMTQCDEEQEVILRPKKPQDDEENVIVPVRTSVRDAIKFIESTYTSKDQQIAASPSRGRQSSAPRDIVPTAFASSTAHEETQTEEIIEPTAEKFDKNVSLSSVQAPESIQKLNEVFQSNQIQGSSIVNKRLETVVSQTPKKITTKVTMNLKKISRRASDVEHLKQVQEQSRHSICNNNELIKRIQMHFMSNSSLQNVNKNAAISASCSSLVPRDKNTDIAVAGKCQKYFCRNCGFTMLPTDVLKKLHSSGRLSIASSLAESLQSIKPDEGSQSMAALRKCHPIHETRSIEDLYIDDDFCQGISQSLAANMELIQPDMLETIDFDLLTAEIFQQHEFVDYTLTDLENAKLDWRENVDEEMADEVFEVNTDEKLPTCDAKNDEPKVDEPEA